MEVIIVPDATAGAGKAADAISSLYAAKPDAVLGLATGSSPLPIYDELAERVKAGELDLSAGRGFALDEYVGLDPSAPQSYRQVIEDEFTSKTNIDPANVHTPDGALKDIEHAGERYEKAIQDAGGVDLQILGIGTDGHIGFNEPSSSLASRTRIKTLTEQTRRDNARFFDDPEQVPHHVITQGLGTIMDAKHLVLVASGKNKAAAVRQLVEGPVSALWPASVLQMHPHVTVIVDEDAAGELELADYYRHTYAHKPDWQTP